MRDAKGGRKFLLSSTLCSFPLLPTPPLSTPTIQERTTRRVWFGHVLKVSAFLPLPSWISCILLVLQQTDRRFDRQTDVFTDRRFDRQTRPDPTRPDQTRPPQTRPDRPDPTRPDRPDLTRPDQTRQTRQTKVFRERCLNFEPVLASFPVLETVAQFMFSLVRPKSASAIKCCFRCVSGTRIRKPVFPKSAFRYSQNSTNFFWSAPPVSWSILTLGSNMVDEQTSVSYRDFLLKRAWSLHRWNHHALWIYIYIYVYNHFLSYLDRIKQPAFFKQ